MDSGREQRDWVARALGKHPSLTIAALAVAGVVLVVALARPSNHALELKCYFKDAQGLYPGAKVRIAGVEVGSVASVRVRPELRDYPAEVILLLETPYELKVPSDSLVSVKSAGIFREVFAEIDIHQASGPPVKAGGVLKTEPSESPTPQQWLECFSNVIAHKPCDLGARSWDVHASPIPTAEPK
jgi:ABC-type transporter Mla subunit MlaD